MAGFQLLATRCGINNEGGGEQTTGGVASRMQHTLPYGAKEYFYIYDGYTETVTGTDTETILPGGGCWVCSDAAPVALGTSYAVGDRVTPASPFTIMAASIHSGGGGTGYGNAQTFDVTIAGTGINGTANVTSNSSGVVITVNSFTPGSYTVTPGTSAVATSNPTGGGSGGTGLTLDLTVPQNQFPPTLQVDQVDGSGRVQQLSLVDGGGFGVLPPNGLACTGGSGSGLTVTLTTRPVAIVMQAATEILWGTQTPFSKTNLSGVRNLTAGVNGAGAVTNLVIPYGDRLITDPVQVNLAAGAIIGDRIYTPGADNYGGRFLSGTGGLHEYGHGNVSLAANTPSGGLFGTATSPANGIQPVGIYGIPLVPGPTVGIVGDSIAYGADSIAGATGPTTFHDAGDAVKNDGWVERAIGVTYPYQNFSTPGDQVANWLSQNGSTMRMRSLAFCPPTIIVAEMQLNDLVTGAISYATYKAYMHAFWGMLLGLGIKEIWMPTCTVNPTSTLGVAASPTIAAQGTGYADGTYDVALSAGTGTPAVINVTVTGGVATVNGVTTIGNYTVLPTNPCATTGTHSGTGMTFTCTFAKCLDQASQSTNAANDVIKTVNGGIRSRDQSLFLNSVTGTSYVARVIDLGLGAESALGNGLCPSGGFLDAKHPTDAQHAVIAAIANPQMQGATL